MEKKDALEREISGDPVTVSLGDKPYPLTFPVYAVALYKQETAKLNVRRARQAQEAGRSQASADELRQMRSRFNQLVEERRKLLKDDPESEQLSFIFDEMIMLRSRIDEESGCGDSLFLFINWWKIRDDDPDRIVLALWAGLHQELDGKWQAPFSISQLNRIVDFSNIHEVLVAIGKALAQHMPRVKDSPNASAQGKAAELGAEVVDISTAS